MPHYMCNGNYDCCGDRCDECSRYMDDCDGYGEEDYHKEGLSFADNEELHADK